MRFSKKNQKICAGVNREQKNLRETFRDAKKTQNENMIRYTILRQ